MINKNTKKMIVSSLIIITIFHGLFTIYNQDRIIEQAKAEIKKANIPSKIEIQKEELTILEEVWRKNELKLNEARETIRIIELEKPDIEEQIRNKRIEMLGK